MNAKPITRRQALASGLVGVAGLTSCARKESPTSAGEIEPHTPAISEAVPERVPWIGLPVLPRQYQTLGTLSLAASNRPAPEPTGPDLSQIRFRLHGASYSVKTEADDAVQVCYENGGLISVKREDLVPVNEAVAYFSVKLAESPQDTFALNSRGWALYLLGDSAKAILDFSEFLRRVPTDSADNSETPARWEGLVNRGLVLAEQGEFEKALSDLDEAIAQFPECAIAWVNRGYTRERKGLYDAAVRDYAQVCQFAPTFTLAMNNLAWVLATCPDPVRRESQSAIRQGRRACEATQNREGMYLDTLAAAYATEWQFEDAVKVQERALEDKAFVARYGIDARKRLQMYRDKKPFFTEPVRT